MSAQFQIHVHEVGYDSPDESLGDTTGIIGRSRQFHCQYHGEVGEVAGPLDAGVTREAAGAFVGRLAPEEATGVV